MKLKRSHKIRLGLLFVTSIALLAIAIYYLGKEKFLFRDVISISTYFQDIKGLKVGNNVRYLGMEAGTVSKIDIVNDTSVRVMLSIDETYTQYIKKDARAQIETEGVMGSKVVTILPGSAGTPTINENDELVSVSMKSVEEFITEASAFLRRGKVITEQFVAISKKINNGEGDISLLLNEDKITTEITRVSNDFQTLAGQLNEVFYKINNGNGDLAKFLNQDEMSTQLSEILTELDTASQRTSQLADNLIKTTHEINSGSGTVNKLLYDSAFAQSIDETVQNLNSGISEITKTAEAIDNSWIINLFSKDKKKKKETEGNTTSIEIESGN